MMACSEEALTWSYLACICGVEDIQSVDWVMREHRHNLCEEHLTVSLQFLDAPGGWGFRTKHISWREGIDDNMDFIP